MKQQSGVTMVEVLIALVVFAIGVGGMAGLQLRTVGMTVDANQRSIILAKSQELADRIRSNPAGVTAYLNTFTGTYCGVTTLNCADSNTGTATSCSDTEMAAFDLWDVFCRVDTGMERRILDWSTTISCTTATCNAPTDTVTIQTDWVSKTADTDRELAVSAGTASDNTIDTLTLSFIP